MSSQSETNAFSGPSHFAPIDPTMPLLSARGLIQSPGPMSDTEDAAGMGSLVFPLRGNRGSADSIGSANGTGYMSQDVSSMPAPVKEVQFERRVTVWHLTAMGYFTVCGGPAGIEGAVAAAGPAGALLTILIFPCIYSVPLAFIVAELASAFPGNGSVLLWCHRAFGRWGAFTNGTIGLFSSAFDVATYPALLLVYLESVFALSIFAKAVVLLLTGVVVFALNVRGLDAVGVASAVVLFVIVAPFLYEAGAVAVEDRMRPSAWLEGPGIAHIQFRTLLNTVAWNFAGWDALGSLAGEVQNPQYSYPRAVLVVVLMGFLTYAIPICVSSSLQPDWSSWDDGQFVATARQFKPYLGDWMDAATAFAMIALFNAVTSSYSRAMWRAGTLGVFPEWTTVTLERYNNCPVGAITFFVVFGICCAPVGFDLVLQVDNNLTMLNVMLEVFSFLQLRRVAPDIERPFRLPGGHVGMALAGGVPCCIILFLLSQTTWLAALITALVVAGSQVLYFLWIRGHLRVISPSWAPSYDRFSAL